MPYLKTGGESRLSESNMLLSNMCRRNAYKAILLGNHSDFRANESISSPTSKFECN